MVSDLFNNDGNMSYKYKNIFFFWYLSTFISRILSILQQRTFLMKLNLNYFCNQIM